MNLNPVMVRAFLDELTKLAGVTSSGRKTDTLNVIPTGYLKSKDDPLHLMSMGTSDDGQYDIYSYHHLKDEYDMPSQANTVGYISSQKIDGSKKRELNSLYVAPEYRKKGIANTLLESKRHKYGAPHGGGLVVIPDPFKDAAIPRDKLEKFYLDRGFSKVPGSQYLEG